MAENATPSTPRSATLSTSKSVRRFTTPSSAEMFQCRNVVMSPRRNAKTSPRKSVAMFPRRNVLTSRRECVTLFRGKSVRMFQELNAPKLPQDNVAPSLDKNVEMFLTSSVARCPRWTARCSTENTAKMFQPKTVVQEASVSVAWFQASRPRRSTNSNVPSSAARDASQSLDRLVLHTFIGLIWFEMFRFVMMSTLLAKFAVTGLKRSVRTDLPPWPSTWMRSSVQTLQIGSVSQSPGRSATTWWSRCPSRPTSRSARPNTLRSAPSLVDTETDLVLLSM